MVSAHPLPFCLVNKYGKIQKVLIAYRILHPTRKIVPIFTKTTYIIIYVKIVKNRSIYYLKYIGVQPHLE